MNLFSKELNTNVVTIYFYSTVKGRKTFSQVILFFFFYREMEYESKYFFFSEITLMQKKDKKNNLNKRHDLLTG